MKIMTICVPFVYLSRFVFNLIEFPITITSENAIAKAPTIGFKKPNAAIGIAKKPDKSENYIMMGLMSVIKMGSGAVHGK